MGELSTGRTTAEQTLPPGHMPPMPQPDRNWSLENRPLSACRDIADAWGALGRRALTLNPFYEPGFLLPAVQHLVAFRDVSALLLWKGGKAGQDRQLIGFMPYRRKARMLRPDTLSGCSDARLLCDWPLLDRDAAVPALSAMLRALDQPGSTATSLRLHAVAPDNPLIPLLAGWARSADLAGSPGSARIEPEEPVAPLAGRFTLREATNLPELRDGVEILMALEASGPLGRAGRATLQDTREAAFLRAMTRQLARARLCQIALLMEEDRPVAAALTLGKGKRRWLYKTAAEPVGQPHDARGRADGMIAALRRATPGLCLLAQGDRGVGASCEDPARDLVLIGPAPRRPADIARSLRARLDRTWLRPRPLAAGE